MDNRCTWRFKLLEERTTQQTPKKIARVEPWHPTPGIRRGRYLRFLAQRIPHPWDHGDGQPMANVHPGPSPGIQCFDEETHSCCSIILPTSAEVQPGRPVASVVPIPRPPTPPHTPPSSPDLEIPFEWAPMPVDLIPPPILVPPLNPPPQNPPPNHAPIFNHHLVTHEETWG